MPRDPYDGKPYYCTECGEPLEGCPSVGCAPETELAAQDRAMRRRPKTSDLSTYTSAKE